MEYEDCFLSKTDVMLSPCCHQAVTNNFFRSTSRLDYYDKKYEFQILTCAHSDIQFMWCDGSEAKERLVLTCNDHAYTSSIHVDHYLIQFNELLSDHD